MRKPYKDNKHIAALDTALGSWTDHRMVDPDWMRTVYMYNEYLVNLLDDEGVDFRGESFKYGIPMCLLVVKGTIGDKHVVSFINGLNRIGCYNTFLHQLEMGEVMWRVDKYG